MYAAGFVAGQAAEAAVDGLPFEADAGGPVLDFGDDVAAGELGGAGPLLESSMASRIALRQLGRLSAILACSGGTVLHAGPFPGIADRSFVIPRLPEAVRVRRRGIEDWRTASHRGPR